MIGRRKFISISCALLSSVFIAGHSLRKSGVKVDKPKKFIGPPEQSKINTRAIEQKPHSIPTADLNPDSFVSDNVGAEASKPNFQAPPDVILSDAEKEVFNTVYRRLAKLQSYVGYGNFNVISWDQILQIARNRDQIGAFTNTELDFIENLFSINAKKLGFFGNKVVTQLSSAVPRKEIIKIPDTGHYLFKGKSANTYQKIQKDVGDSIVLTSGVRGVVKQLFLFLNKTAKVDGNLSLASYSLAPPGHSYHALGDFDVGKKGFGHKNFSAEFTSTDEFKRLSDLGYLDIRYPLNNSFGVRYEPWHIKVI